MSNPSHIFLVSLLLVVFCGFDLTQSLATGFQNGQYYIISSAATGKVIVRNEMPMNTNTQKLFTFT